MSLCGLLNLLQQLWQVETIAEKADILAAYIYIIGTCSTDR